MKGIEKAAHFLGLGNFQIQPQYHYTTLHSPTPPPDSWQSPFKQKGRATHLPLPMHCSYQTEQYGKCSFILFLILVFLQGFRLGCKRKTWFCPELFLQSQRAVQTALFLAFSLIPRILHLTELLLFVDRTFWPPNIKCMMSLSNLTPVFHSQALIFPTTRQHIS